MERQRMKYTDKYGDEICTTTSGEKFAISITKETDSSPDGGYTFTVETNTAEFNKEEAVVLLEELKMFLK